MDSHPTPKSTPGEPASRPRYEVVVCSYNGEPYIADQLHSILTQNPPPEAVLVSDDGSTDRTRAIVKQTGERSEIPVRLLDGPGQGVIRNMLGALRHTTADYVFLADQDDLWLDHKARVFTERMHESARPHLIFSDAWVWYPQEPEREKVSFWQLDGLRPDNARSPRRLAFHNTVQGASACVNRALIEAMAPTAEHPDIVMHDWWLALIATGLGRVEAIDEPTLLYRQHSNNQIGSQKKSGRRRPGLSHRRAVATRILRQAAAFADHYGDRLAPADRVFFRHYRRAMGGNFIQKGLFIPRHWPRHRDLRHTITLWASIVLARGVRE